jgi:hypothetical protein
VLLVGCVGVAVLAFLLVVGKQPPSDAVASVKLVPVAESAPLPAATPEPAPPAPTATPAARPVEKVEAKKHQRGKRPHRHRTARR